LSWHALKKNGMVNPQFVAIDSAQSQNKMERRSRFRFVGQGLPDVVR